MSLDLPATLCNKDLKMCTGSLARAEWMVAVNTCGAMKEWISKALTMKGMLPPAPTDLYNGACLVHHHDICWAFTANQPRGTACLVSHEGQVLTGSFKTCNSLTEQRPRRYEIMKAKGIWAKYPKTRHSTRCTNPLCSPTWHLLPSWKVDCMTH